MLRRLAQPGARLLVAMVDGRPAYAYDTGERAAQADAQRLISAGWVEPADPLLFGEVPQAYQLAPPKT